MTKTKHRSPALRRICTPLLGLSLALPLTAARRAAGQQAAGPTSRPSHAPSFELKGRPVEDVRITGNTTVSFTVIRNLIRTQIGDKFDPAMVQDDYQRIFDLKKFANVDARVEPTKTGGVIVVFDVTEQQLVKSVAFHGNHAITSESLKTAIDIKDGQAIDSFRISLARQTIVNQYRDQNFPFAHVEVPGEALSKRGDLIFDIVEGPQVRVRNIEFKGNRSIEVGKLKEQIKSSTYLFILNAGKYDPEQVDEDVAAIRRYYEGKGFFDARVDRKLIYSPDNTELEIDFVIDEGRRYTVNRISFEGNSQIGEAAMKKDFKLKPGMAWDNEYIQSDVKKIVTAYSPLGYIYLPNSTDEDYLRVEPKQIYLQEPGKVDLVYQIHEGKRFNLGGIYVRGNHKSQDKLVLREFRELTPGSLYNSSQVQETLERLKALPYFSGVTVNPIGDDPNYRDILVDVQEGHTASFNIGAGINSNGGVGGNLTYRQSNFDITNIPDDPRDALNEHAFTGAGQSFVASFEPGTIATNASLRFTEPYIFDQAYSFSDEIYLRDRLREAYDDRRFGDRVSLQKRFDYNLSASISLRAEGVKIYQVQDPKSRSEQILEGEGTHPLTSASLQFRNDTTNPGFLPYKGTVISAGYEYVGALGGDYRFHKLTANIDGYQSLGHDLLDRKTVLGLHGFAGYIPGESPFFERFYGGGIGSLRGFRFRGVGPRDGRGADPIGGNFAATASAEINFPVYTETLRGVVFTDVGDFESQFRLGTIRSSVGVGIRLILPFLGQTPLAIDFAVPITKADGDESQLISFSLGFAQ
ncbi:MAG TPA: BamA/TamA family outer membrane protein [Tepidisphaeraceae bacterium]|nr:BamA/TamA family outer membrane protein [Tepidisphaeraceae bacterium]